MRGAPSPAAPRAAAAALVGVLLCGACGDTILIDPDADWKASLVLREARRFTIPGDARDYVFVRIPTRRRPEDLRLSLLGAEGRFELASESVIWTDCASGSCGAWTGPGGLPAGLDRIELASARLVHVHARSLSVEALGPYGASLVPIAANRRLEITIDDPIRRVLASPELVPDEDPEVPPRFVDPFPRAFDAWLGAGGCGPEPAPDDEAWTALPAAAAELELRFEPGPDASTCVAIRPRAPGSGPAVLRSRVRPAAVLEGFERLYAPPVVRGPVVWRTLFDYEIPTAERCEAAQRFVEATIAEAADAATEGAAATERLGLPPVQIAVREGVRCRQTEDRSFDANAVADEIEAELQQRFGPEREAHVVLVFASNLDLPLPDALRSAVRRTASRLAGREGRRVSLVVIGPESVGASLDASARIEVGAIEEPEFRAAIVEALLEHWPHRTELHAASTVVPLGDAEAVARYAGFRVCDASHEVEPLGTPLGGGAFAPGPDGPALRVALPVQRLVPSADFRPSVVRVRWQGCAERCDRPPPRAPEGTPWWGGGGC